MDKSTGIGISGAAVAVAIAFAALIWPHMSPYITYPGFAVSVAVAIWGLWPFIPVPRWRLRIPLQEAAQRAYETAEREGWLSHVVRMSSDPEARLDSFKYILLVDPQSDFRGAKPPSTKSLAISRAEIGHVIDDGQWHLDVRPISGESRLNLVWPHDKVAFENVTVAKRDLERLLREWRQRTATKSQSPV